MPYNISSRGYLRRARRLLDTEEREALFHAAFELRCGIQARLQEYLQAHKQIAKSKREGWKIPRLAKNLEQHFRLGDKVAELIVFDKDTGQKKMAWYYTPVTSSLKTKANGLGSLLHALEKRHDDDDPWWIETRQFLEGIFGDLEKANRGTLMGPPLGKGTGKMTIVVELESQQEAQALRTEIPVGKNFILKVDYLDDVPEISK